MITKNDGKIICVILGIGLIVAAPFVVMTVSYVLGGFMGFLGLILLAAGGQVK